MQIISPFIRFSGNLISGKNARAKLLVLMYHRVLSEPDVLSPDDVDIIAFDWQMELLKKCFNILPLEQALEQLLAQPELRARLGQAARATIDQRHLTWDHNASRVVACIQAARSTVPGVSA